jgi:hypothetical protein
MSYPFSLPAEGRPGLYRDLMMLVTGLLRFLEPAFYCRSWAPWWRIVISVVVIVVLIVITPLLGQLFPVQTM